MINEETLTLYFYDDGLSADEGREIEIALGDDAERGRIVQLRTSINLDLLNRSENESHHS